LKANRFQLLQVTAWVLVHQNHPCGGLRRRWCFRRPGNDCLSWWWQSWCNSSRCSSRRPLLI